MSCDKAMCCKQMEDLKVSAVGFGFDMKWLEDLISQHTDSIISLIVEAVRLGLTRDFVVEVINKFGPAVLSLLVSLFSQKNMKFATSSGEVISGEIVAGDQAGILMLLVEKFLPDLIQKYLPVLIEKHKDQLIQMFLDAILSMIKK